MGGERREKREEGWRGARRKGRKIKKRNMPRRTQPMRNKKLRKETSEGGGTKLLPSPGVGAAEQMRRWAHRQAGPPQGEREGPATAPSQWWGEGRVPRGRSREAGRLAGHPGWHLGPSGMQSPPSRHPLPGPCTHPDLGHQGALSCRCWAGDTQCWALTAAPCRPQGSAKRRKVSHQALRRLDRVLQNGVP